MSPNYYCLVETKSISSSEPVFAWRISLFFPQPQEKRKKGPTEKSDLQHLNFASSLVVPLLALELKDSLLVIVADRRQLGCI